ncbi:hypothetical protein EVAR_57392_1 [Eumeta japonica]|uniref:Craniofacial development protein 2 n=1 Tax=Eumeta variegata TaxID=151549 RepID=A0A4C1YGC6_EUMVA|nr:hypothetical protein EVAR_57392_1 [Eumeta japonica]
MWTRKVRFGTLNMCGGMDDKINDVCELIKDRRLDILCMNETKSKSSGGAIKPGSRFIGLLLTRVNEDVRALASSHQKKKRECVNGYECENPRLLLIQVKIRVTRIFVLGIYVPDIPKLLEEREEVWADVREILVKCERNDRIVMLGIAGWVINSKRDM